MTPRPTLTLGLNNFAAHEPADRWRSLLERACVAEEAGVDRLVVVDHVVMGDELDAYDGGRFPTGPDGQWLEPLTTLGVIAGRTTSIRLSTGILVAALRNPAVLAKALATLDVLSGGRLDVGVGIGWQAKEYEAVGLDFARRGALLDESLAALRALWSPGPTTFEGSRTSFTDVWCEPKPVRPGGVPLWVSGRLNPRTLRRMVAFGDGWIPWGEFIADVRPAIPRVHEALAETGRDVTGFDIRATLPVALGEDASFDAAEAFATVPELVAAGVTDFQLAARLPRDVEATRDALAAIVAGFRAAVGRSGP